MSFHSFNHWTAVADALDTTLSDVVRTVAFKVKDEAQAAAPVDTGFLKSSIYVVTAKESTYGEAGAPPKGAYLFPEVEPPADNLTAFIGVGANYGAYQEYGTRFQPGTPFLHPAIEQGQVTLDEELSKVEGKLAGSINVYSKL